MATSVLLLFLVLRGCQGFEKSPVGPARSKVPPSTPSTTVSPSSTDPQPLPSFSSFFDPSTSFDPTDLSTYSVSQLSIFSSSTRIMASRNYARVQPYLPQNISPAAYTPSVLDLAPPTAARNDPSTNWNSAPFRLLVLFVSYSVHPALLQGLSELFAGSAGPTNVVLPSLTGSLIPAISILYGTLGSLTASFLYARQENLQRTAAEEAALLSTSATFLSHVLKDDVPRLRCAGQLVANHVATMVGDVRGVELMLVAYADPFQGLLDLLDEHEREYERDVAAEGRGSALSLSQLKQALSDLSTLRARRLSAEAQNLPPTNFLLLGILSLLLLSSHCLVALNTVAAAGVAAGLSSAECTAALFESRVTFTFLVAIFTLFFNFTLDLNNPFQGVYQVRREGGGGATRWQLGMNSRPPRARA